MTDPLTLLDLAIRILCAVALGAAIGLERQWRVRTAGIRTNALVAAGSALFVIIGTEAVGPGPVDPTRVAAQVVSGIGFLGAGVILRDGLNIRGLTTAATLWCAAAVGSLSGAGFELVAALGCFAIIATNVLLRPLARLVNRRTGEVVHSTADSLTDYMLEVVTTDKNESRIRALVLQMVALPEFTLRSLDVRAGKDARVRVLAGVSAPDRAGSAGLEGAIQRIGLDPKVVSSRWWPTESED